MKAAIIVFLCVLVEGVFSDDLCVKDLPEGCPGQLLSMLTKAAIAITGGCKDVQDTDIELMLYTRKTANNPTRLSATNPTEIDPKKKLVLLFHGWVSNRNESSLPLLKDAYLERYDCNLVIVDWGNLAWSLYTTSVCYVPKVAQVVANFLCLLQQHHGVNLDHVHLAGHSLGAQIAGLVGQKTKEMCDKKPGRITAMDPAGPLYIGRPKNERLDRFDATFVDVIHTNAGVLGYLNKCGDVDFFINCGRHQVGCVELSFTLESIKNLPVALVTCHHSRSVLYMIESIKSDEFQGRICEHCPGKCAATLFKGSLVVMGENCPIGATGGYTLPTNRKSPFGQGETYLTASEENFQDV